MQTRAVKSLYNYFEAIITKLFLSCHQKMSTTPIQNDII